MAKAGHTNPKTTLGIYAQVITSETDHGAALDGLVEGPIGQRLGSEVPEPEPSSAPAPVREHEKTPR